MPKESLQSLYNTVSEQYDIGTYDSFSGKMQDPKKRRIFYDSLVDQYELPDYETFELKVSSPEPFINADDIFPEEEVAVTDSSFVKSIYESVRQQENSVAKNNPYGVNMPRKKSNAEKIFNLGGSLMAGSQTLLEFEDMDSGVKAGEEIIDNILQVSDNDPATFYSNYSGLDKDSPEVRSFVEIFNKRYQPPKPQRNKQLESIIKALEQNKDNPKYIMRALDDPDPDKKISNLTGGFPKFAMGIPTSEILAGQQQARISDVPPVSKEQIELEKQREALGLPFTPDSKDVARFLNKRMLHKEMSKELKKGKSPKQAYKKVFSDIGGTPPNIVNLGMENSVTGSVFRSIGLEQDVDVSDYPAGRIEHMVSSAISMVMPVDAALFAFGGQLGKVKQVAKYADEAANLLAKRTSLTLAEARIFAKNAFQRIVGGAGGFATFDAGASIADQIETTGSVDPIEALHALLKGTVTGATVGSLGLAGTMAGRKATGEIGAKAGEFAGEVFGLGTVPTLLAGEELTFDNYLDAAGTIVGIKAIKSFTSPKQVRQVTEPIANEFKSIVETTGKPLDVVANTVGRQLKTSLELAMEGKTPTKVNRGTVIKEIGAEAKPSDVKVLQPEGRGAKPVSERVQLNQEIKRLAEDMSSLERNRSNQRLLDDLQFQIDAKVARLNEIGVGQAEININLITDLTKFSKKSLTNQFSRSELVEFLDSKFVEVSNTDSKAQLVNKIYKVKDSQKTPDTIQKGVALTSKTTPGTEQVRLQMKRRSRSEQQRLDKYLQEKDVLNRPFEPDPMLEVPLHPADVGRKAVRLIESEPRERITEEAQRRVGSEGTQLELLLETSKLQNQPVKVNSIVEVPVNPTKQVASTPEVVKPPKRTVEELPSKEKLKGYLLQKEYADLDVTIRSNEQALSSETLTPTQRQKLEASNQKAKELKRDVQERADSQGIELMAFFGIPSPSILKSLFGSSKKKPRKYNDAEINRLYQTAMDRISKKEQGDSNISFVTPSTNNPPVTNKRNIVTKIYNHVFSDMVERAASVNTPSAIQSSQLGRQVIDRQKQVRGELAPTLDKVLELSGKGFGEDGKVIRELSDFVEVDIGGNKILQSKLHAGIEGNIKLSPQEKVIIEKQRDLIEERGRIFERNNIYTEGKDGVPRPFKVIGREIAPRIMSNEFYAILGKGAGSKEFTEMVSKFAQATGSPEANVREYFKEFTDNISGKSTENPTRTTQVEHSRKWKHIPHAIEVGGDLIPLVEYRPYEYAQRLAETGAARVGVATTFGQEINNTSTVDKFKKAIESEGGTTIEFHEMIRALSGAPIEAPILEAGSVGGKAMRAVNSAYNTVRASSLSASVIPNVAEFLGSIRRFSGTPGLIKGLYDLKLGLPSGNAKALEATLNSLGAFTSDVTNLATNPIRPVESRVRQLNEAQRSAFLYRYLNEFQEKISAVVASNKVQKFKNQKGTGTDALFLREMGFSRSEAELMVSGKAPQELYDALIRRAPAALTGGAQRAGEQSRLEQRRLFRAVTAFETYAQMKIRSLNRIIRTNSKAINESIVEQDYKKLVNVTQSVMSDLFGGAVSGASAQFLLAYMYGGKDNVEIKWNEVQENPWGFIAKSWAYTTFAGLYGQILQSTAGGKDSIMDVFYPWVLGKEVIQAIGGTGRYTYDEGMDKAIKFGERFFPANRVFKQTLVGVGLGNPEASKDDNAIRAYYRWKFENKYGGTYISKPDEEIKKFRRNMNKAYDAIMAGDDPSTVSKYIVDAVSDTGKDPASISKSIIGKRLLIKSKIAPGKSDLVYSQRLAELRKRIGDKAYKRLLRHDELLDMYSEFFQF